ncbi:MAG: hypothetical protein KGJ80_20335, partial [Chloroflexota bacterium]|nr:hypothetical protein [Chloroflexota bacterium]
MSIDKFRQAEDKYFLLKGRLEMKRITRKQFDAELKQLMFQDAQGRYWMIGADSGKWNVYDGRSWVEAPPPTSPPAPLSYQERGKGERFAQPRS